MHHQPVFQVIGYPAIQGFIRTPNQINNPLSFIHSILGHSNECWEPYDSLDSREILERVVWLKRAGE